MQKDLSLPNKFLTMTKLIFTFLTLSALSFNAQEGAKTKRVSNMKDKLALRNQIALNNEKKATITNTPISGAPKQKNLTSVASFSAFSSSANIYGVVAGSAKPLQYNENVDAVSFIQRKSATYVGSPFNNTGVILAMVSSNWGSAWDSTCIYSDGTDFGRYPQGAIYSAPGNTNIANAYVVGSGPTTDGAAWTGNWFASKQLGVPGSTVYNSIASATPGAQQFFSTSGTFGPNVFSNDFAQYGFSSSDNGKIKSLGILTDNPDGSPLEARGGVIQTGSFNAGVFTWQTDSFLPPVVIQTSGSPQLNTNGIMAWNKSGIVGYAVFIGSRSGQTLSNKGWQPIVYKTTNSGTSWTLLPGIDFNTPAFQVITSRLDAVPTNTTLAIPFFNPLEGIDCSVDMNDKLHIAAVIASTGSEHNDSLSFTNEYTVEQYVWPHTPGKQEYLYDFIGDGTAAWSFLTVDSVTSEAPGSVAGSAGFSDNPWDDDGGKVTSDSRIQLSRTPDGKYIIYTWAESDPNFTNGAKSWNTIPNVKARMWSSNSFSTNLSGTEINITKPSSNLNPSVANKAMFHFTSPTSSTASVTTVANSTTVQVKMPLTITNSFPYIQGSSNTHYYSTETLNFVYAGSLTGLYEQQKNGLQFSIYPNPTNEKCHVIYEAIAPSNLEVTVLNYLGQIVNEKSYKAQLGNNDIELDLSALKTGIYFVSVKEGNRNSTKKLIIE